MPPVALHAPVAVTGAGSPRILRVTELRDAPTVVRSTHALIVSDGVPTEVDGFGAILWRRAACATSVPPAGTLSAVLPGELDYVAAGDILRIDPTSQHVRVLYRRSSPYNSLLVTERCNSKCLMCSQPPVARDDGYLVEELLRAVPLMSRSTAEIGITGGEPTLLGENLFRLLRALRDCLPRTSVHLLSNGRRFQQLDLARRLADVRHPDLVLGIPLYADVAERHDYVVQAHGAFDETIRGLLNLGRFKQRIELRVVLHKQTIDRLPDLARYITRNLPFAEHVALMGLELMGYARPNLELLWMDPAEYQEPLAAAVHSLDRAGLTVSIYNSQLCVMAPELWPFAKSSISDWKRLYLPECDGCAVRHQCGGFFGSSSLRRSAHIRPIPVSEPTVGCK